MWLIGLEFHNRSVTERHTMSRATYKHHQLSARPPLTSLQFLYLVLAVFVQLLSVFLPSKLLTMPKDSENMEIRVKQEPDIDTSNRPIAADKKVNEDAASLEMPSPTASSSSVHTRAGTETPRSVTPASSVESNDDPGDLKNLNLSSLWTEQSEKARRQDLNTTSGSC